MLVSISETSRICHCVFFLMIRRPPRSTLDRSSAASDVYKRQTLMIGKKLLEEEYLSIAEELFYKSIILMPDDDESVSYTHLRAHETVLDLVCRLLLEKKKKLTINTVNILV